MGPLEDHITVQWRTWFWSSRHKKRIKYYWGPEVEIIVWRGIRGSVLVSGQLGWTKTHALQEAKKWSRRYGRLPVVWWDHHETEVWPTPGRMLKRRK